MWFLLGAGAPQQPLGWDPGCCPHSCAPSAAGQAPPSPGCHFCPLRVCGDRQGVSVSSGDGPCKAPGWGGPAPPAPAAWCAIKDKAAAEVVPVLDPRVSRLPGCPQGGVSAGPSWIRSPALGSPFPWICPCLLSVVMAPEPPAALGAAWSLPGGDRATSAVPRGSQSCDSSDNIPAVPHPEGWGTETLNTGMAVVHKIG